MTRRLRDKLACGIANLALNHIATESYRRSIDDLIRRGLAEQLRDLGRGPKWGER